MRIFALVLVGLEDFRDSVGLEMLAAGFRAMCGLFSFEILDFRLGQNVVWRFLVAAEHLEGLPPGLKGVGGFVEVLESHAAVEEENGFEGLQCHYGLLVSEEESYFWV